jgi:hypothetical protein
MEQSTLSLVDDNSNRTAETRNNNVEKGRFMWGLFYISGELAYGIGTDFKNRTNKKFRKTFRENKA